MIFLILHNHTRTYQATDSMDEPSRDREHLIKLTMTMDNIHAAANAQSQWNYESSQYENSVISGNDGDGDGDGLATAKDFTNHNHNHSIAGAYSYDPAQAAEVDANANNVQVQVGCAPFGLLPSS